MQTIILLGLVSLLRDISQRTAIVLKHDEGLSYVEIAQVMDTSLKSVEMLIRRAREKLQSTLSHLKKSEL